MKEVARFQTWALFEDNARYRLHPTNNGRSQSPVTIRFEAWLGLAGLAAAIALNLRNSLQLEEAYLQVAPEDLRNPRMWMTGVGIHTTHDHDSAYSDLVDRYADVVERCSRISTEVDSFGGRFRLSVKEEDALELIPLDGSEPVALTPQEVILLVCQVLADERSDRNGSHSAYSPFLWVIVEKLANASLSERAGVQERNTPNEPANGVRDPEEADIHNEFEQILRSI